MDNLKNITKPKHSKNKVLDSLKSIKSGTVTLFRYSNKNNLNSDIIRGWTWYAWLWYINRYKNHDKDIKLWWKELSRINIAFNNPFIVEDESDKQDIIRSTTYSNEYYKDNKFDTLLTSEEFEKLSIIEFEREDDAIIELVKNEIKDPIKQKLILKSNFYPMKTMTADNIISSALKRNWHDALIRKDQNNEIIEVFIIEDAK